MDIKLKLTDNEELEKLLPNDRIVNIDNNILYLYDEQFNITNDMIEEIINGSK